MNFIFLEILHLARLCPTTMPTHCSSKKSRAAAYGTHNKNREKRSGDGSYEREMSESYPLPPQEIELKLLFEPEAQTVISHHLAAMALGRSQKKRLITTYYDTPDLQLRQAGLSLRVRHSGSLRIQTLKTDTEEGQLAIHRGEWEWSIRHNHPDMDVLSDTPYGALITALATRLKPVWVSHINRTTHTLPYSGAMVEAAIDEGCVQSGNARDPVRELELELKDGPVRAMCGLALALQAIAPLRLGVLTKAERGYRLFTGKQALPVQGRKPPLTGNMTLAEGFRILIHSGLNALINNQSAAEAGNPEGVHQMRVAIRQLRTVLQIVESRHVDRSALRLFQTELQRIGRELGEVRDWDVLCLETLPAAFPAHENDNQVRMLTDAAQLKRTAAYQKIRHELQAPALTALVLSLSLWIEAASFPEGKGGKEISIGHVAPTVLDHLQRKVMRRGRRISHLSPKKRHTLRKSLKKLRYVASYLDALYPARVVKAYMKHCKKLLQQLGKNNDTVVASTLALDLRKTYPDLAQIISVFTSWNDRRHHQALSALSPAWKRLRCAPLFWHK